MKTLGSAEVLEGPSRGCLWGSSVVKRSGYRNLTRPPCCRTDGLCPSAVVGRLPSSGSSSTGRGSSVEPEVVINNFGICPGSGAADCHHQKRRSNRTLGSPPSSSCSFRTLQLRRRHPSRLSRCRSQWTFR
jgi:predicted Zn-ribbon and HTH transcriptional regulator